jgi:hypothetical protein
MISKIKITEEQFWKWWVTSPTIRNNDDPIIWLERVRQGTATYMGIKVELIEKHENPNP